MGRVRGTATSASSSPTTPTRCGRCSATPTSRWSTATRRSSRTAAWAGRDVQASNPTLVYARCRPSRTPKGTVEDFGLLVEAQSGFCTQLAGHRPGPIFVDVRATGSGTAFLLTASVLALLHRRAETGAGGWAETSLYDGMLATLGLHDRSLGAGCARDRGVLGEGLDVPELPVPLRRRRAHPGVVRRQGHVRHAPRGPRRRAERRGLLRRPDGGPARRAGGALGVVLRPATAGRLDRAAAGRRRRVRTGPRSG